MLIKNSKNSQIINLNKVTQIIPSINEEKETFNLYFVFDAMNSDEFNEAKWELGSKDELEMLLCKIDVKEV